LVKWNARAELIALALEDLEQIVAYVAQTGPPYMSIL
jgi:hypothetical protein